MKDSFKYQGATDPPELAAYLRALADGLISGPWRTALSAAKSSRAKTDKLSASGRAGF